MVRIGQGVVCVQREVAEVAADFQPKIQQGLALIQLHAGQRRLRRALVDQPDPGMHEIFGDNLVPAVVGLLQVAREDRVRLQDRVESI